MATYRSIMSARLRHDYPIDLNKYVTRMHAVLRKYLKERY